MISTENNKDLEEIQKEKQEIQELHIKIKNLDNDPELKNSLAEALISKTATDHNIVEFYDYPTCKYYERGKYGCIKFHVI